MILKTTTNEFCFINVSFYETVADPRHFFSQEYDEMPEYEEESDFVYEDMSEYILKTSTVQRLLSFPNVALTSHQGFFTEEALTNIAETTLENAEAFRTDMELKNAVSL